MRLWMVRLGKYGEQEQRAIEKNVLATGWQLPDLSAAKSRNEILRILEENYPDGAAGTLRNWSVQLNQLKNKISDGDLVITPLKTTGRLAIGRIENGYVHTSDLRPARRVCWIGTDFPRNTLKQDLLYSLGASQTVCEISRNDAAKRVNSVASGKGDPGYGASIHPGNRLKDSGENEADEDAVDVVIDLVELARDQIERHIASAFAGHAFTQLIAAILRAQGYQARVSPPGNDKGIDIVAGQGGLGFGGPRLVVQVKSGDTVADQPTLQGLLGCIQDTHADHGLLVSWSGFTAPVRQRVNELYFRVRLWDRAQILDALFTTYDELPEEIKADLPLRRTWTLVNEESA